jgi:hypothetical protein
MNMVRLLSLAAVMCAVGCETSPRTRYESQTWHNVSGTVTLDGQPLAGALVRFVGKDRIPSSGVTDAGGVYHLQFDTLQSGITGGAKQVEIRTRFRSEETDSQEGTAAEPVERLPAKYNEESTLTASVSATSTRFDFDLTSE